MPARIPSILVAVLATSVALSAMGPAAGGEPPPEEELVPVLAQLDVPFEPEGDLTRGEADDQREEIKDSAHALRTDLKDTEYADFERYKTVPYVSVEVSQSDLDEMAESPEVAAIHPDVGHRPSLAGSTVRIEAPAAWASGATGAGQTIAILDTGVDASHPFLAGKVIEQACYSAGKDCPNGQAAQFGAGAAVPCGYSSDCAHGTHVAGIAAGKGASFSGVAPGANIMAVQVFSHTTGALCGLPGVCALAMTSDLIKALERVYSLRNKYTFAAVNMSLGWGSYASTCDSEPMKLVIDNLRAMNIATVVASGNAGNPRAISSPACISSAVSVGATTDSDPEVVPGFSNSSATLSLLAPGQDITSSVPGGGFATYQGTSMAAPHVAGAWAVLKGANPTASVSTLLANLQSTARPITDARTGATIGRLRVWGGLSGQGWVPGQSPTAAAHVRHVSLRLTGHLVARGAVTSPDGPPECLLERVTIERRSGKHWRNVKATTTHQNGEFRVHVPNRRGLYRAWVPFSASCQNSTSPSRRNR